MVESPEALCREAEKKMSHRGFLSFFVGGPNYDAAVDLFVQAANKYKLEKRWKEATDTFVRAAYAADKGGDKTRQASLFMDAGHCAKKISCQEAAKWYAAAGNIYNTAGRFGQSARTMKIVADMLEEEEDCAEAAVYYKKAADLFDMDEYGKSQRSACILKYAEFSARYHNKLQEAIEIFEAEGEKALRNSLMQFGAKDWFLKAGLLRLLENTPAEARTALERYETVDSRFATSREGKLLRGLVTAFADQDSDRFVAAIREYDTITPLDSWRIHFLAKIKESFGPPTGGAALSQLADDFEKETSDNDDGELDLS